MRKVLDENFSENQKHILRSVTFFTKVLSFSVGYEKELSIRPTDDSNRRNWKVSITESILQCQVFIKKERYYVVCLSANIWLQTVHLRS